MDVYTPINFRGLTLPRFLHSGTSEGCPMKSTESPTEQEACMRWLQIMWYLTKERHVRNGAARERFYIFCSFTDLYFQTASIYACSYILFFRYCEQRRLERLQRLSSRTVALGAFFGQLWCFQTWKAGELYCPLLSRRNDAKNKSNNNSYFDAMPRIDWTLNLSNHRPAPSVVISASATSSYAIFSSVRGPFNVQFQWRHWQLWFGELLFYSGRKKERWAVGMCHLDGAHPQETSRLSL